MTIFWPKVEKYKSNAEQNSDQNIFFWSKIFFTEIKLNPLPTTFPIMRGQIPVL